MARAKTTTSDFGQCAPGLDDLGGFVLIDISVSGCQPASQPVDNAAPIAATAVCAAAVTAAASSTPTFALTQSNLATVAGTGAFVHRVLANFCDAAFVPTRRRGG